jgi:hypothetical protein
MGRPICRKPSGRFAVSAFIIFKINGRLRASIVIAAYEVETGCVVRYFNEFYLKTASHTDKYYRFYYISVFSM